MHRACASVRVAVVCLAFALPAAAQEKSSQAGSVPPCDVAAFIEALSAAGARSAWPGFEPRAWPVAVFDGTQTFLFHHPSPPADFAPVPGAEGIVAMAGRHPAVVANTVREIGGVSTATIAPRPGRACEDSMLAVTEELFHVFWSRRHTNYRPNEMVRYAYPVKGLRNLRRIFAEDEALARALEAEGVEETKAWTALALQVRAERASLLRAEEREWELATEMLEGPANYVSRVVVGQSPGATATRLRQKWTPDEIRWRYYNSGAAICFLLDRLEPRWKEAIDADIERNIVQLLADAIARSGARRAAFSKAELARFEKRAAAAIVELSARQKKIRSEVFARAGTRIVVEIPGTGEPLRLGRFDPVNLMVLGDGEVLHPAFITLSNGEGSIQITNRAASRGSFDGTVALTRGAGSHPMRDIRSVTIAGVGGTPRVDERGGALAIEAEGIRIALPGATLQRDGTTLRVTLNQRMAGGS